MLLQPKIFNVFLFTFHHHFGCYGLMIKIFSFFLPACNQSFFIESKKVVFILKNISK